MKKIEIDEAEPRLLNNSHLQGHIYASYQQLVGVFGQPKTGIEEGKVTVEWTLRLYSTEDDRTVYATIYDWKSGVSPEFNTHWNVGGFNWDALDFVSQAIEESQNG